MLETLELLLEALELLQALSPITIKAVNIKANIVFTFFIFITSLLDTLSISIRNIFLFQK